ncbi:MAG: radical SAM protein [bacterium]
MKTKKSITFVIPSNLKKIRFFTTPFGLKLMETFSHFIFYNAGTLQLASIMKRRGHDVKFHIDTGGELRRGKMDADVVCISLTTAAAPRGYEIAKMFPDRKVIIGGPHASALPAEAARYADHVVTGEGEGVLPEIIEGRVGGKIINGGLIENLDGLPYMDFSLLPFKPKNFPVITSRGCPFNCNFCAVTNMFGRKVRMRSPRSIVDEVKYYVERYGEVRRLDLISPNFTIQRDHCRETLKMLLAEGIRPALEIRSSTHVYRDPEIPGLLSRFPVVSVLVGAESFDEESLRYYKKGREKGDFEKFVKVMKGHGLKVCASFVWGNRFDTVDSIWRLLDRIEEIKPAHFHIAQLTPFPGTDLYSEVSDRIFVNDWSYYDLMHVTHFHPKMDPYTMQKTWIEVQKEAWSLRRILERREELFSPPINKLFYWIITRRADVEFEDFLEFLKKVEYGEAEARRAS